MNVFRDAAVWPSCRFLLAILSSLVFAAAIVGCARGERAAEPDSLAISIALDKPAYRPGEAVLIAVQAVNNTGAPLTLNMLNTQSLVFMFGRQGDPERMERRAVASELENLNETMTLEPGGIKKGVFLLTRLTEFVGPMALQVHYTPGPLAPRLNAKLYSNTAAYTVQGNRLFKRDPAGFITKEDAIAVAGKSAGGEVEQAEAVFVRDEAGFYKWWVNLKLKGSAGPTGWLVDPYLGSLWHKAKPFDPKLARDPRFERPPGLPPLRIPSRGDQQP